MTFVVLMIVFIVLNLVTFFFCKERVLEDLSAGHWKGSK